MATLLHSDSRRLYSWWWDSHISPKNSKWLQENLTDMDAKVKAMIKLIEEDADSFARRAEMYYKKRPELMKLVEEFYRAYRALAERYDHATVELRQAHRTMVEAFPNQVPRMLADDSTEGEPHSEAMPNPVHALLSSDELHNLGLSSANGNGIKHNEGFPEASEYGISKQGLKQLYEIFGSGESQISKAAERKVKKGVNSHGGLEGEAETEGQRLKKILSEIKAEKDSLLLQYQESLQKLSDLERDLKDAEGLGERASRAEIEIKVLKETLAKLEGERDDGLLQYKKCIATISSLENIIFRSEEDARGLNERAIKAETEAQILKQGLSELEAEKEAGLSKYTHCLQMISILEKKISLAEENARLLNEQTEKAEMEVKELKQALAKLSEEKEAAELRYKQCLDRIAEMESEISNAYEDVERLNEEILTGLAKLKTAEEQCFLLEMSNQSLKLEADELAQKISMKDQELIKKESDLDKLQNLLNDERLRFLQLEATLQTLQKSHYQSQEEQRALALELENRVQMLKDLETCNHDLNKDLQLAKEESQNLNELNSASSILIMNLQNEIASLKEMKEKLEESLNLQVSLSNSLQKEIQQLKEEIERLNGRYQTLLQQVLATGLNPECLGSSVKGLQHENLKLKEVTQRDEDEKELLYEKLRDMNTLLEKNVALERSLSELNDKLEESREKVKELKESCQFLQGEKSGIAAEKSALLSQLQMMTENMQQLLQKNATLESSLSGVNIELEGLRMKSKSLEDICEMLKDEKSNLVNEKSSLVSQLANVEQRLANLERRFTRLEEKYVDLEKEKESTVFQIKELQGYLGIEKQERAYYVQSSESRLDDLEKQVNSLQEERGLNKKEFEEELDKAVKSQVEIFVLQKFIQDLEDKNLSLVIECQKHVEASKLSKKVISELETENLEQQVEVEFLLDEIEKLRMEVHQVFRALQLDPVDDRQEDGVEEEQVPLVHILHNIENLKSSLLESDDEKQKLIVENSVLQTLIEELTSEGVELGMQKKILEQECQITSKECSMLQNDKDELAMMNNNLRSELSFGEQQQEALKAELQTQHSNLESLHVSFLALEDANSKALGENKSLLQKFSDLKQEMHNLEEENSVVLLEALTLGNLSTALQCAGSEKTKELQAIYEDLSHLRAINSDLMEKLDVIEKKLKVKEAETLQLNVTIEGLGQELREHKELTDELNVQMSVGQDFLRQKATELLEAEQKLEVTQKLNAEFGQTIEVLKDECVESEISKSIIKQQVRELSDACFDKEREIKCLHEANENLESEVSILHKKVEERQAREESLSLELQEKSNEFELWEAEASSFYFDFQVSSIREVLLENKVRELTAVFDRLEDENAAKSIEIEEMKEKHSFLENEVVDLKGRLSAYVPVISSLSDDVQSLERNVLLRSKLAASLDQVSSDKRHMGLEAVTPAEPHHQAVKVEESAVTIDRISDLLTLQSSIKAIEKAVVEDIDIIVAKKEVTEEMNTHHKHKTVAADVKPKPSVEEVALSKSRSRSNREYHFNNEGVDLEIELGDYKPRKMKTDIVMKDIQLDHVSSPKSFRRSKSKKTGADDTMLKMWESAEGDSSFDSNASHNKTKHLATRSDIAGVHRRLRGSKKKISGRSLELQIDKEVGIDRLEVPAIESREPNDKGKTLERLASDAQKLVSLQTAVQDLKKKMESKKKTRRAINLEFEEVKRQVEEVEEAVVQLSVTTDQLKKVIEENPVSFDENPAMVSEEAPPGNAYTKKVTEQARKGAEQIGRLQFEVQSIQYILLKLEDENRSQGRYRFPGTRTGIVLRDFIHVGRRNSSKRRKKGCFCGCGRPSGYED